MSGTEGRTLEDMTDATSYCGIPEPAGPKPEPAAEGPFASCVLCQEPTEYPESTKGITLCPVCEWQEAQRTACSG
ncbi:hypothetical protein GCM10017674_34150 [Streptomyces gardneri]|uniref:Uncharacterized protein n=2 Tax=Streptomyces gardneri TaxID=66892 RepID=A0A4Y3RHV1_9ACTN|nr:hypothetical protein SGA01_18780 [Streptomyces gardneri]GHG99491.1 hypothetical protein GCM10017674_34150 [Streptomyces gardneri]